MLEMEPPHLRHVVHHLAHVETTISMPTLPVATTLPVVTTISMSPSKFIGPLARTDFLQKLTLNSPVVGSL